MTGLSMLGLSGTALADGGSDPRQGNTVDPRRSRGLEAVQRLTGATGEAVIDSLSDIAPDLADWIVDFAYGDVISRPELDLRSRQFATIAALTTAGTAAPQLKVHVHGGLNAGCTPREIVEVILQMAVYAGFPAALNALSVAREVFTERGVSAQTGPADRPDAPGP